MSAIMLRGVTKRYRHYSRPFDRLLEVVTGHSHHDESIVLKPIDLDIAEAEVVGVIGLNGAGKSTLLKLIAGTLPPTSGEVVVNGRISALLELGTGFHPEMTGRSNVLMSCAVSGIGLSDAKSLYREIVEFAGLSEQMMDQPIKTFSSGMVARLAFSVATAVEPEVLIVDELLSVGDGVFSRKSFDRVMDFKRSGKTMLFCSHSMYQVEAICDRVIWLNEGEVKMEGEPAGVVVAYNAFLDRIGEDHSAPVHRSPEKSSIANNIHANTVARTRILNVDVSVGGAVGDFLSVVSGVSDVTLTVRFASEPALPCPSVAVRISDSNGRTVTSLGSFNDGVQLARRGDGCGQVEITLPRFPLLKGRYWVTVLLLSEDGIHVYESARMVAELKVEQRGLEQGVVSVPRKWRVRAQ